jgi:hypothetical protein
VDGPSFQAALAVDALLCMRQCCESISIDVLTAGLAHAEGAFVQSTDCTFDAIQSQLQTTMDLNLDGIGSATHFLGLRVLQLYGQDLTFDL